MTSPTPAAKGAILVVDDEQPIGELLQQWLQDEGYRAAYAEGFGTVQTLLEKQHFDLITLDIMMPDADGLQVLEWVRAQYPDTGVVMATALGDLDTVLQAMRLGASGYLIKPFNMELVTEEIGLAMERQRLIAENRAYQHDLERKVSEQTQELRAAYEALSQKVRELEARDRLLHFQMSGPGVTDACREALSVLHATLELSKAVAYRPEAENGYLEPVAAIGLDDSAEPVSGDALEMIPAIDPASAQTPATDALCAMAYTSRAPVYGADGDGALPRVYQDEVLGVIAVSGLDATDRDALARLGLEAAVVLWSARVADDLDSGRLQVDELLEME